MYEKKFSKISFQPKLNRAGNHRNLQCNSNQPQRGVGGKKLPPSKGSTFCKGMINIYRAEDRQRKEADKSFKAIPVVSYAFYTDIFFPSRIGSVAIYGENAFNRCFILKKRGFFFGKKIISANVEYGLRPFVGVKLVV